MDFALPLTHSSLSLSHRDINLNKLPRYFFWLCHLRFFFLLNSRASWRCCCVKIERKTHKKDHRKRSLMICFVHLSLTISSSLSFTWVLKNWWPILKFWCFFNCSYVKDVEMTIWLLLFGHFPLFYLNEIGFVLELFIVLWDDRRLTHFFRCFCWSWWRGGESMKIYEKVCHKFNLIVNYEFKVSFLEFY